MIEYCADCGRELGLSGGRVDGKRICLDCVAARGRVVTDADEPTPLQRAWPVGAFVTWLHALPGGYGFVRPVPATVLATNSYAGTVKITAASRGGRTVERWVRPERLRRDG